MEVKKSPAKNVKDGADDAGSEGDGVNPKEGTGSDVNPQIEENEDDVVAYN